MSRGKWRLYSGVGIPCDLASYVDVCDGPHAVWNDVLASQAFDAEVTHWRPSPDERARTALSQGDR